MKEKINSHELYFHKNRSQNAFYGVDLTSLKPQAFEEYFRQPIVDTFDSRIIVAFPVKHTIDFQTSLESDLYDIKYADTAILFVSFPFIY